MPSQQLDWTLPGAENQPILGTTHMPPSLGSITGVLIICHGFKGYKDYGFFPYLAEQAARRGLFAVRFNFSHGGLANNLATFDRGYNFDRLDLFERDTWGKQITDLANVALAARGGRIPGIDEAGLPLIFFGHSRGGVTALLTASRMIQSPQTRAKPAGVITAAAPADACSLDESQKQQLRTHGYLESPSTRTGQNLRIGRHWLREIELNPQALDPLRAATTLACPWLIIHGEADATVPVRDAHRLRDAAGDRAQFLIVPGASHTFDAPNPMPLNNVPAATARVCDAACGFAIDRCTL